MTPLTHEPSRSKFWRFLGVQWTSIAQSVDRQLRERGENYVALWSSHPNRDLALRVSDVICRTQGWPNNRFVPDDPFDLLLPFRRYDGMDAVDTVIAIEKALELPQLPDTFWDECASRSFGEVVQHLARQLAASTGPAS